MPQDQQPPRPPNKSDVVKSDIVKSAGEKPDLAKKAGGSTRTVSAKLVSSVAPEALINLESGASAAPELVTKKTPTVKESVAAVAAIVDSVTPPALMPLAVTPTTINPAANLPKIGETPETSANSNIASLTPKIIPKPVAEALQKQVSQTAELLKSPVPSDPLAALAKKVTPMSITPSTVFKGFDDISSFSKANFDALIQANQLFAKGIEQMSKEMVSLTQSSIEHATTATKAVMQARSLKDVVELNTDYTKSAFDKFLADSTKLTEMGVKVTTEAMAPVTSRVNVAMEKIIHPTPIA